MGIDTDWDARDYKEDEEEYYDCVRPVFACSCTPDVPFLSFMKLPCSRSVKLEYKFGRARMRWVPQAIGAAGSYAGI